MILSGKDNSCVFGLRTLKLISPHLEIGDIVRVGILPKNLSNSEIEEWILIDQLLSTSFFGTRKSVSSIFTQTKSVPNNLLKELAPAMAGSISTLSDLLGVSAATLYGKSK